MRRGAVRLAAALAIAMASAPALADPICADRPGKGSATCTTPAGHFQIETGLVGWSLTKAGGTSERALVLGETFVKYGVTDRFDIQVGITPWQRVSVRGGGVHESASGFGDILLLAKHRLTGDGAALQVSLYPYVKVPAAKRSLGNRKWEAGLIVPIGYSIADSPFSISLSPEFDWVADGDGHGHHAAMAQVVGLGWAVSDRLSLSGELWGQWDWDPGGVERQASADVSAAYLVRNDLQLDAGANFGLNRQTPDVEIYVGVAKRF